MEQLYRWIKASERLPQFENAPDDFGIVFRNLKQVKTFTVYPSYTKNITALLQNNLDNWEWLEPIEEKNKELDYWKQRCKKAEYMITSSAYNDFPKQFAEWQQLKNNL